MRTNSKLHRVLVAERDQSTPNDEQQSAASTPFASRFQVRFLFGAMLLALGLFSYEIVHYLVATDLGATDHAEAWAAVHPQCKEVAGPLELSCPFPGYNSVQLQCLASNCGARDPNFKVATDSLRAENIAMYRNDSIASLDVEAPFNRSNLEWRTWAQDLRTSDKDAPPKRVDMNKPPQRLEDAWRIVEERSLTISRQTAYMHQREVGK